MKSTDPQVLEALESYFSTREEFGAKAREWTRKYGGPEAGPIVRFSMGAARLLGLAGPHEPQKGRWTKMSQVRDLPEGHSAYRPYANSVPGGEASSIAAEAVEVPGLPKMFDGEPRADGEMNWLSPQVFSHEGVAFMSLSANPAREQRGVVGEATWEECLRSEVDAASEARDALIKT
jgi:hypothetical protein